ncbi:MAG: putative bifunctional diguanylate cyclase/phosphodiesterase [Nitrospiria bacterium]
MRIFIAIVLILFGGYAQRTLARLKGVKKARQEDENRFRVIFEQGTDSIILADVSTGTLAEFNEKANETLGYTREEFRLLRISDFQVVVSEGDSKQLAQKILEEAGDVCETKYRTKDGRILDILETRRTLTIQGRDYLLFIFHDITERKRAEESRSLAATVFETATEGITVTDAERNIIAVNPAFTEITGYSAEEVIGKNPRILQSGRHDDSFYQEMWGSINRTGRWSGEIWERRKNGEVFPEWLTITAIKDKDGKVIRYTGMFSDITKQKLDEENIYYRAHYDLLTGLANRLLFSERVSQAMKQSRRNHKPMALLFIDLDRFKHVNDTLGHSLGDHLLQEAGARLQELARETDTVARSGGDEFLIVLPDLTFKEDAGNFADKIIQAFSESFCLEGRDAFVSASIGITMFPADAEDIATLFKNADMAMYQAKTNGRNRYRFFNRSMTAVASERATLEWDLRGALERDELVLCYQPIIDLQTGRMIGTEALLRWHHPHRGVLLPEKFIPLAEESELIVQIGEWVLLTACKKLKEWHDRYALHFYMSVNMSTRQFNDETFPQILAKCLEESGLSPALLTLEITESLMMDGGKGAVGKFGAIKKMGIQLSIDDFGTGYSSLSYLSRFPIDFLKIDKSFIHNVAIDPNNIDLIEAIITMAHSMKLKVIAEGIETHKELVFLRDHGCDAAQGNYYSKSLLALEMANTIKKGKDPAGRFQVGAPITSAK